MKKDRGEWHSDKTGVKKIRHCINVGKHCSGGTHPDP